MNYCRIKLFNAATDLKVAFVSHLIGVGINWDLVFLQLFHLIRRGRSATFKLGLSSTVTLT